MSLLRSTAGMSLIEVLTAAAILVVVSLLLVTITMTMASVAQKSNQLDSADASLSQTIATTPQDSTSSTPFVLELTPLDPSTTQLKVPIRINAQLNTYSVAGRSLVTIELLQEAAQQGREMP